MIPQPMPARLFQNRRLRGFSAIYPANNHRKPDGQRMFKFACHCLQPHHATTYKSPATFRSPRPSCSSWLPHHTRPLRSRCWFWFSVTAIFAIWHETLIDWHDQVGYCGDMTSWNRSCGQLLLRGWFLIGVAIRGSSVRILYGYHFAEFWKFHQRKVNWFLRGKV